MQKMKLLRLDLAVTAALSLGLVGCGGGGGSSGGSAVNMLEGTFATGKGQKGTILIRGSKGNEAIGLSNGDGSFSIDVSSLTEPYKIKAETVDKETVFYSYSETKTYTNVNQLTTLFLKETLHRDSLEYLFKDNTLLSREVLEDAEEAMKNDLLVQIYSTGLDPNKLSLFKTKFDPNKLGYDAILEKFSDKGVLKEVSGLSLNESKDIQRLLSHYYIKNSDGGIALNTKKLTKDTFNSFFNAVVEMANDKEYMATIEFEGNSKTKYALKDAGKNFLTGMVIGEIKQLFIETFGTILNFSDEDKEFITQLSSVAFKNNIFDAISTMYRGLKGEDTSTLYNPLLEALHNSTLGDPAVAAKELNDFFGIHGTVSSVVCEIPVLNSGREESCKYIEDRADEKVSEYEIDFNAYKVVDVSQNPTGFQVTSISPETGKEATEFDMNNQAIMVEFNQRIYQSGFAEMVGITSATMSIINITNNETLECDRLRLVDQRSLLCTFENNEIGYNSKYAFSVEAENSGRTERLSVISSFTTPAFPVDTINVSKESGVYRDKVNVEIVPNGYEIYYTLNDNDLSIGHATLYAEGSLIDIDRTSVLRMVAYKNGAQVSPVVRKVYNIIVTPEEVADTVKPDDAVNPIDTSKLTLSECKEKTVNTTFETNTWTTSLSEWNEVHIACLPILAGISTEDESSGTEKTSLSYMRTHPDEKLASGDCKAYAGGGDTVALVWTGSRLDTPVSKIKSWSDVKGALQYDLAPGNNMMKSIEACKWVQTAVSTGQLTFEKAISSVNIGNAPFSDSAAEGTSPTVPDITGNNPTGTFTGTLTLAICKQDYDGYSSSMWAQITGSGDKKATACYQALVAGPMVGMDPQLYIDAYNNGWYSY